MRIQMKDRFRKLASLICRWPISVLATGIYAYLPTFFMPVISSDEAGWATMARYIFSGLFYERISDNKPPLHFQIHWLASFGETSHLSLKIFIVLWTCFGALGLYKALLFFTEKSAAQFGAFLFTLFSGAVTYGAYSGERIITPLCIWATFLALSAKSFPTLRQLLREFSVGLVIGAAFQVKQTALVLALPSIWILTLSSRSVPHFIRRLLMVSFGGISISWLSWTLVGVPFSTIWREAFQMNFTYVQVANALTPEAFKDLLGNIVLILCVEYLPLILAVGFTCYHYCRQRPRAGGTWRSHLSSPATIALVVLVSSILCLSVGGRFYQQYFSVLLPSLCVFAVISSQWKAIRKTLIISGLVLITSLHVFTTARQLTNQNRNWNDEVVQLIERIRADTTVADKIWISNSLYSAYWMTGREPAVRYLYFLQVLNYVDPCRAPDSAMVENSTNQNFQKLMRDLQQNSPKIIFWTQNPRNNCSDRIKISNFPTLKAFIEENYDQVSATPLGLYFMRRAKNI
jgi:hypothetical protein